MHLNSTVGAERHQSLGERILVSTSQPQATSNRLERYFLEDPSDICRRENKLILSFDASSKATVRVALEFIFVVEDVRRE
jgi:hypothetical protein